MGNQQPVDGGGGGGAGGAGGGHHHGGGGRHHHPHPHHHQQQQHSHHPQSHGHHHQGGGGRQVMGSSPRGGGAGPYGGNPYGEPGGGKPAAYGHVHGEGAPAGYGGEHAGYGGGGTYDGMARSGSDASMTLLDSDANHGASGGGGSTTTTGGGSTSSAAQQQSNIEKFLNDDTVPTVFRWEHGGRQVYITGTFNGWSRQIPMHRSGNDFTYIHNLKRGKHAFKFIVDDEWRFAPDQPTVADIEGRINNFIDVTDFKAYTGDREFEKEKAAAEYGISPGSGVTISADKEKAEGKTADDDKSTAGGGGGADGAGGDGDRSVAGGGEDDKSKTSATSPKSADKNVPDRDGEVFGNTMPDLDDYTKEPPPLPPHLRHIILNKPPQLQDTAALPVPQHVALNHLYCTAIKDNMMVLGITQRFKTKFVTTVYYSPCANTNTGK